MNAPDFRRIGIFLLIAFGIAWASALYIYLNGGLVNSPQLGGGLTLALVILAGVYMTAPAVANILARLLTREGWKDLYLRPHFRRGWLYWLICWFTPAICVFLGMALFFQLFPQYYDPTLGNVQRLLEAQGVSIDPGAVAISQTIVGVLIAPIVNALPTLGEEFGWRAYLLPKLLPVGARRALLLTGVIWGVWHWPVIAMGYEYGFNYPGFPWTGMLLFLLFTVSFGTLLGWAVIRAGSVWPAVIGHGAINGIAQIFVFFTKGQPPLLLGPAVNGLIGSLGVVMVALLILIIPRALEVPGNE